MPAEMVLDYENAARRLYFGKPQCQRDEAIRTGAIAATAMMYAANALGLGSTPMIAFDPEPLAREFGLAEDEVPVMLVAVGAKLPQNWPQKPRRPVADVLEFV
jgi:nitroreductase